MARNIFRVNATIVDENGNYSTMSGFPKTFDSNSYEGNVEIALRRAKASFHSTLGTMYAVDNRQMQTVTLTQADGRIIPRESEGRFIDPVEPEPEVEEPSE